MRWLEYLLTLFLLGLAGGLLISLGRPEVPLVSLAALAPFAVVAIWPPRRPRRQREPWGQ